MANKNENENINTGFKIPEFKAPDMRSAEEIRQEKIQARKEKIRQQKQQVKKIKMALAAFILVMIAIGGFTFMKARNEVQLLKEEVAAAEESIKVSQKEVTKALEEKEKEKSFFANKKTKEISASFPSQYAILVNADTHDIIAQKGAEERMNPASMTKVLSTLVACEMVNNWDEILEMTMDVQDYCYINKCSVVGYVLGETILASELPYGTILPSGADATLTMAKLAAGSHEAFVEAMNKKVKELGLSETSHFCNAVGIFEEDHYTTVKDMAIIMYNAMKNDEAKAALTARTFHTEPTEKHPSGQDLSNWFIRRIEDQDCGKVTVIGAKTGYVGEAGFCAVSYATGEDGTNYICVTGDSTSSWQTVYDHAKLYKTYIK